MADNQTSENDFEVSIRILGNEMVALSLKSNNANNKWIAAGIISIGLFLGAMNVFGPTITSMIDHVFFNSSTVSTVQN